MKKLTQIALLAGASVTWLAGSASAVGLACNFKDTNIVGNNVIWTPEVYVGYQDGSTNYSRAQEFIVNNGGSGDATINSVTILGYDYHGVSGVETKLRMWVCPDTGSAPNNGPADGLPSPCVDFGTGSPTPFQERDTSAPHSGSNPNSLNGANPNTSTDFHVAFTAGSLTVASGTKLWAVLDMDGASAGEAFVWRCSGGDVVDDNGSTYHEYPAGGITFHQRRSDNSADTWLDDATHNTNVEPFIMCVEGTVVPEPETYAAILGLVGFMGVIAVRARRK